MTINEIANKMQINRKTVMHWLNNYEINKNIERKEGSGRKRKTTVKDDNKLIKIIQNNDDLSLADIKNYLKEKDIIISISTIFRRLIENDYVYRLPIKKPFLTDEHKKKD